jgi:tagatose-1,6-bisphosphate aldolase
MAKSNFLAQRLEWSESIAESLEDYTQVLQTAAPAELQEAKEVIEQVASAASAFLAFYNTACTSATPK